MAPNLNRNEIIDDILAPYIRGQMMMAIIKT